MMLAHRHRQSRCRGVISLALLLLLSAWPVGGRGQTRRPRRAARRPQVTQTTQPVRVPQLPPPAATPTPPPTGTPTPPSTPPATPLPAQSTAPAPARPETQPLPVDAIDDEEIVRVTSNLVVVPAAVTDAEGQPVQGLQAADFHLEEEGRGQQIAQVGDAEQVPLDIVILFDVSSSVTAKNIFAFQQESAARFLRDVLKPADRAAIVTIAQEPQLVQPLAAADVVTTKLLTIPAATVSVPTAFYDAVSFAAQYLNANAPGRHRRVILVISDGDDNFSNAVREQTLAEYEAQRKAETAGGNNRQAVRTAAHRDLEARHRRAIAAVQRDVQRADIVFYSINPGGPSIRLNESATRAQNGMQQLAEATGGTGYVPDNSAALTTVFRQIANELRAQYLLQYYSNSNAPNGKFLNIKVTTPTRAGLRVRARQGYYVKK